MTALPRTVTRLVNASLSDGRVCDVELAGGLVASVNPAEGSAARVADTELDLEGFVLLPAPAEPHAHLDKALLTEYSQPPVGDLNAAIQWMVDNTVDLSEENVFDRARRSALTMLQHGTTAIRSHVDTPGGGDALRSIRAVSRVKRELADIMDMEIVVLATSETPVAIIEEALDISGGILGGVSHLMDDPSDDLEQLIAIAERLDVGVDMHTDESLDGPLTLGHLARRTRSWPANRRVAASHCVRLSTLSAEELDVVIDELIASRVSIVSLPITNLYLQGWGSPVSTPRGIAPLRTLIDRGVSVAAGADNVRDPFNPVGRSDALETASLLVSAGHLTIDEAYRLVSTDARRAMGLPVAGVSPGARADLLAVRAVNLADAVANASMNRFVLHGGRLVAQSVVTSRIAAPARVLADAS